MGNNTFYHALKISEDLCIGCLHCVTVCPTEAIRVKNGKSKLIDNYCIDCGECYRVCPSDAIIIDNDDFNSIFNYKYRIALIPAVFIGQFPDETPLQTIYSAVIDLGFTHVYEVENGVDIIAEEVANYQKNNSNNKPLISTYCPAIVRLVQVKFPSLVDNLVLQKPPLDIAALFIQNQLIESGIDSEEIGIFYIAPCAAKIAAIKDPVGNYTTPIKGVINMDIFFNKAYRLIKRKEVNINSELNPNKLSKKAILFSLTNGETDIYKGRCLAIDEIHNVIDFLEKIESEEITDVDFLELRSCDKSCAGGALTSSNKFLTIERLRNYSKNLNNKSINSENSFFKPIEDKHEFLKNQLPIDKVAPRSMIKLDDNIGEAIKKMEKATKVMHILPKVDCALCGAPNCQALSRDIAQGEASIEQCVFIQKILEQKGELSLNESVKKFRDIWGFSKINKYKDVKTK